MFGILLSALNVVLGFIFRGVLVKFGVFFALYFVVIGFASILKTLLPTGVSISSAFEAIPPGVWYFLDAFALNYGLPMILAAFVTRFVIRRIPVIG